uniref:Uncharacterized protein n=1 Tax=Eutreptiella gymnastica TaxID=73025 RepID=A0A7S1HVH4_9EUGL
MEASTERLPLLPGDERVDIQLLDKHLFACCGQDSTSILILYRLASLDTKSAVNFSLSIVCLLYAAINVVCFMMNTLGAQFVERHEHSFHLLEFWGTFIFSLVSVFSLVYSPRPLGRITQNPVRLKLVVFFNVAVSLVPALLVSVDLETFEVIAHEIEYTNELTMVLIDLVILASLVREFDPTSAVSSQTSNVAMLLVSASVAVVQLLLYNSHFGAHGELVAHYFEFSFELFSAMTMFWFCLDNKLLADMRIKNVIIHGVSLQAQCPEPSRTASQTEGPPTDYGGLCPDKVHRQEALLHAVCDAADHLHKTACPVTWQAMRDNGELRAASCEFSCPGPDGCC